MADITVGNPVVPSVYADEIRVNVSTATITLLFGQSDPWANEPIVQPVAQVKLSPVQFKALARLLPDLVATYERSFGEIAANNGDVAAAPKPARSDQEGTHE